MAQRKSWQSSCAHKATTFIEIFGKELSGKSYHVNVKIAIGTRSTDVVAVKMAAQKWASQNRMLCFEGRRSIFVHANT